MKRIIWVLMIGLILAACDKLFDTKNKNVELASTDFTGCKGMKSVEIIDSTDLIIVSSSSDRNYLIKHFDVKFNCCLPEGIAVDARFSNDTIYFSEWEKVPGECRCLCNYDVSAGIRNLDEGEYVLCIIKDYNILGTTTLFFKENMKEKFYISELTD